MFGMPSCKEVSRLVSESMETKLPLRKRIGLWMHLSMCRLCRGFSRQLRVIQAAAKQHGESEDDTSLADATLSANDSLRLPRRAIVHHRTYPLHRDRK